MTKAAEDTALSGSGEAVAPLQFREELKQPLPDGMREAVANEVAPTDELVSYIARYGGMCRDCAAAHGVCPSSGLPCDGYDKAIRHVLQALSYGIRNGYLPLSLSLAEVERLKAERDAAVRASGTGVLNYAAECEARLQSSEAQAARYREALEFYRDEWWRDYIQDELGGRKLGHPYVLRPTAALKKDKGRRARSALSNPLPEREESEGIPIKPVLAPKSAIGDAEPSGEWRPTWPERLTACEDDGGLDEVVVYDLRAVHLERTAGRSYFLSLTRRDGSSLGVWIGAKAGATWEARDGFAINPLPPEHPANTRDEGSGKGEG